MEKKEVMELDEDGDDEVEGEDGSEEIDVDGEDVDDEATMDDVLGNGGTRSLGLGLPCLQGKVRNLVSTTASP